MFEAFYFWIAVGIAFLLVEMATATFYGLSLSVAGFILAAYAYTTGVKDVMLLQWVVFAGISAISCLILPKWLNSYKKDGGFKTGVDAAIDSIVSLSKAGDDWKVKIDGVDYLVDVGSVTEEFASKKRVRITGHDAGLVKVELISQK